METKKEQILKTLIKQHIETIKSNKLDTVNGGEKNESIRCPTDID